MTQKRNVIWESSNSEAKHSFFFAFCFFRWLEEATGKKGLVFQNTKSDQNVPSKEEKEEMDRPLQCSSTVALRASVWAEARKVGACTSRTDSSSPQASWSLTV